MQHININVNSEIGKLDAVIIHQPGPEIESMSPENAHEALYSDILNKTIATSEYLGFSGVLKKYTNVFEVTDLLEEALADEVGKQKLIESVCAGEKYKDENICKFLDTTNNSLLAVQLIQGVNLQKDNLTKFLSTDKFCINPLPNFFFTRDASFSVGNEVMISKMANDVRYRETLIMNTIFKYNPIFKAVISNPVKSYSISKGATVEGGDVLVARDDILIIGNGARTSTLGIDAMIEHIKTKEGTNHIIVQKLLDEPESFIHLDMVFTLLDKDKCMIYEPLIFGGTLYPTTHITVDNHKVTSIKYEKNILSALKSLGMELEPVRCGGALDDLLMKREQWHSGANFFTLEPGKIMGYGRNLNTIEALNKVGFDVVTAKDIVTGATTFDNHKKMVITIEGSELSRGGGGARCMTMPVSRQKVDW